MLSAMRRGYTAERYLERLAAARAAIDDLAVTTDIIVGFPGETERDFEDTLAVAAEAAYDSAYTFIFSPRPGTRAAAMEDEFIAPDVIADRFDRLKTVVERSALARHQARVGRVEEVLVEGVSRRDESMLTGRTRQGKLVHFAATGPGMAGTPVAGVLARVTITAGHPHHLSGVLGAVTAAAAAPGPHPGGQRLTAVALVGVTASGKSEAALGGGAAARRHRDRLGGLHVRVSGMDLGTSKPSRGRAGPGAAPPDRPGRSGDRIHRLGVPAGRPTVLADIEARGRHALLVGGTGPVPAGGGGRPAHSRAAIPMSRRPWRPSSMTAWSAWRACTRGWPCWIRWGRSGWSRPTGAGSSAPSRSRSVRADPSHPSGRAWRRIRPRRSR